MSMLCINHSSSPEITIDQINLTERDYTENFEKIVETIKETKTPESKIEINVPQQLPPNVKVSNNLPDIINHVHLDFERLETIGQKMVIIGWVFLMLYFVSNIANFIQLMQLIGDLYKWIK